MGLLDIPLEILAVILEAVVLDVHALPALIEDERKQSSTNSYFPENTLRRTQLHVQSKPVANSTALLSCCKYIATQTRAAVDRLDASNRCVFKLGVLLIGERQLWTTWLCLPFVPGLKHIKHLEISIRIADGHQELVHPTHPVDRLASAIQGPGHYATRLLDRTFVFLIVAVLCRSAMLDIQDRDRHLAAQHCMPHDSCTLVDHIRIDISTCENAVIAEEHQHHDWLAARPHCRSRIPQHKSSDTADLQSLAMRPEWLASMLGTAFSDVILNEEDERQLLFDRVGDLSILLDGNVYSHFDLGRQFVEMNPPSPTLDVEGWFGTPERRAKLGFPVGRADPFISANPAPPSSSLSSQDAPRNRQKSAGPTSRFLKFFTRRSH